MRFIHDLIFVNPKPLLSKICLETPFPTSAFIDQLLSPRTEVISRRKNEPYRKGTKDPKKRKEKG
jgi:hypothetical protein